MYVKMWHNNKKGIAMLFYEDLKDEPIFMGFNVKPAPDGNRFNDKKQPVGVDSVYGVSANDLDSRLGTYDQALALKLPFLGISLMRPVVVDNCHVVCIDLDWKRSPTLQPKPAQAALMERLLSMGAAYEKSYSGYGCHIFVKIPTDLDIPKTVELGNECHIEIFCGQQSQRANILITDDDAQGELIEVDLMDIFDSLGIDSTPSTAMELRSVDITTKSFDQQIVKATFTADDLERLRSAMAVLPPAQDYNEWYTSIGLALKNIKGAADGAFDDQLYELWDEYSQRNAEKYTPQSTLAKWNQPETNIRTTLGTVYHKAKEAGWTPPSPPARKVAVTEYVRDKKGLIEPTQQNLRIFMQQYQLRYDEFGAAYMGLFDDKVQNLIDEHITQIQYEAEVAGFKRLATAFVRENAIYEAKRNSFDSAIEWGNSLVWDNQPRCDHLLVHYFGASDSDYTRAASLYIASAMGGRLMDPGCKADAAIVLIGKQGAGKSTAISALTPLEETFLEINLSTRDADLSRQLRGKLIGEIAELRGLHSREAEDIKAFMSRTHEKWVPKYKEFETTFARRLTFWGTSNEMEFLSDHTGNRRWLPVEIKSPNADLVKQDRDQIWAEAIDIYRKNGILWQEVQDLAPEVHKEHTFIDPLQAELEYWLINKDPNIPITIKNFHASTKMGEFSSHIEQKQSRAIGRAFTALGYTGRSRKIDGVSTKVYSKEQ